MLSNEEVVRRFLFREEGRGRNLSTDGNVLWSHQVPIARWVDGVLLCDVRWHSLATIFDQVELWSQRQNFYPWDDLRSPPDVGRLREAEGVAVEGLDRYLFVRLKGWGKTDYFYVGDRRIRKHFDKKRLLDDRLEAAALAEYVRAEGWRKQRIGEAILSGDRARLIAALLWRGA